MRYRAIHNELFKQLEDQDSKVRAAAAYSLGKMKVRRGIKHLARALQDHIPEVRYHAVWALGMIRDPKAFVYLKIAKLDNDSGVQCAIQQALYRLTQPSTDSLIDILANHPNSQKRFEAAKSLGILCESQALEALVHALKDPSLRVRLESIQAIGYLHPNGDPNLLKKIIVSLNDDNPVLRRHVVWAIRHLLTHSMPMHQQNSIRPALQSVSHGSQSQAWMEVTTKLQDLERCHAVKRLLGCLRNDPDPSVRVEATKALGHLLGYSTVPEPRWNESRHEGQISSSNSIDRDTPFVVLKGGVTGSF